MLFLTLGLITGVVMRLTGSGGALISIPLFMSFFGHDVKLASFYSLFVVILASLINLIGKIDLVRFKHSLVMIGFSVLGSRLSAPLKQELSNTIIAGLLILISLFSLYKVWTKKDSLDQDIVNDSSKFPFMSLAITGVVLGGLTTLTGLGGGVLLMPIFISVFQFSFSIAIATSLFTITLSSVSSLIIQFFDGAQSIEVLSLSLMALGIVLGIFFLKPIEKILTDQKQNILRKLVFTIVVAFAMIKFVKGA